MDLVECKTSSKLANTAKQRETIFDPYNYLIKILQPKLAAVYKMPRKAKVTFSEMQNLNDILYSKMFHGMDVGLNFTKAELRAIVTSNKV